MEQVRMLKEVDMKVRIEGRMEVAKKLIAKGMETELIIGMA